jgi:unsaturated rhamnogalacturonyl hydrolase
MTILERVYRRTIETGTEDLGTEHGMDIWQWDEGVAMYGFAKAYEKTKDKSIIDFMEKWLNYHLDKMDFGLSINTAAPLLGVMTLLELGYKDERYEKVCRRFASWCISEAPRADRGTFEHSCTANKYDNQIWADTLFMGCLFLLKWGLYSGDSIYVKEAVRQFGLHYKFLSDSETGLVYHGYDCNERQLKGVLWGRGNAWFAIASVEVLNLLPKDFDGYDMLYRNFIKHFNGVIECSHEDGAWHTVMDKLDTYAEMSATAAFAYSINKAAETGLVDKMYKADAEKAVKRLAGDIDQYGGVSSASLGTCVMQDYKKYNDIGVGYSCFAQGLAMMALTYEQ